MEGKENECAFAKIPVLSQEPILSPREEQENQQGNRKSRKPAHCSFFFVLSDDLDSCKRNMDFLSEASEVSFKLSMA